MLVIAATPGANVAVAVANYKQGGSPPAGIDAPEPVIRATATSVEAVVGVTARHRICVMQTIAPRTAGIGNTRRSDVYSPNTYSAPVRMCVTFWSPGNAECGEFLLGYRALARALPADHA